MKKTCFWGLWRCVDDVDDDVQWCVEWWKLMRSKKGQKRVVFRGVKKEPKMTIFTCVDDLMMCWVSWWVKLMMSWCNDDVLKWSKIVWWWKRAKKRPKRGVKKGVKNGPKNDPKKRPKVKPKKWWVTASHKNFEQQEQHWGWTPRVSGAKRGMRGFSNQVAERHL